MEVELCCKDQDSKDWDSYVMNSQTASLYHLFGWRDVVQRSFGHETFYLMAKEKGQVVGILPLVLQSSLFLGSFMTSLPFFNYGGICGDDETTAKSLFEESKVIARQKKAEYVEFRHYIKDGLNLPTKKTKVTMKLQLSENSQETWQRLSGGIRNRIRKAEKSNLKVTLGGCELLDDFYRVFSINMRDLGTPVYSKGFFLNILKKFPENTKLFTISWNQETIASSFTIGFKDSIEVPWSSALKKYKHFCPNMLLYWKMLEYACQHGYKYFDFGRSSVDSGTYEFKRQWGAQPKQLYWQYWLKNGGELPQVNPSNPKYKLAIKTWQMMPVWLTRFLGPVIAKNLP